LKFFQNKALPTEKELGRKEMGEGEDEGESLE
jgi:hypothetical protein